MSEELARGGPIYFLSCELALSAWLPLRPARLGRENETVVVVPPGGFLN
jgi:hypothetical protein